MLKVLDITQFTVKHVRNLAVFKLYFTDIADILNRKWYYNKSLREVIQVILLFIRGRLGSQSCHFVPIFKTSIYGYSAFVDNKMLLETLNVSKI